MIIQVLRIGFPVFLIFAEGAGMRRIDFPAL
jgi:hypothetical protein